MIVFLTVLLGLVEVARLLIEFVLVCVLLDTGQSVDPTSTAALEAARAERRLHDVTRQAFVSMAEAAERNRTNRQP